MREYDAAKFRELLEKAIGTNTKQAFAEKAGMAPQQLSRYFREDYNVRPTMNTLQKIAKASGDDSLLVLLQKACGYEESVSFVRTDKPFEERAKLNAMDLKEGFKEFTKTPCVFNSIKEFISTCETLYGVETLTEIMVSNGQEYTGNAHLPAEYTCFARVKFETLMRECYTWIAFYYAETRGGLVVIFDVAFDADSLYETGAMTKKTYEENKDSSFFYVTKYKNGKSFEENMLSALFGDIGDEYVSAVVGFGFYIDDLDMETFRTFLFHHKKSFAKKPHDKVLYAKAMREDPVDVFASYSDANSIDTGYGNVIAHIMREETDFDFVYFDGELDQFENNRPCIMVPDAIDAFGVVGEDYTIENLKEVTVDYARELGIPEYGEVHVNTMHHVNCSNVFKTEGE